MVKIASRCNLNCTYCYVYNMGDDRWMSRPAIMEQRVQEAMLKRIATHCTQHEVKHFEFIFHGGEPMLAGQQAIGGFVEQARAALAPEVECSFAIQTNGVLLNDDWCQLMRKLDIRIGISMDATRDSHDRQRIDHMARGSFERVRAGFRQAQAAGLAPGLLAVLDLAVEPAEAYRNLCELQPRVVDFLLPQATWDAPPPRTLPTPYADWLLALFDLWSVEEQPAFRVRVFDKIIGAVLGFPRPSDALGMGVNATLVVETDGSIEAVDVLRVCENGITARGFNVLTDTLDEAMADQLAQAYYFAAERLCPTCRQCPVRDICAGGYLPHLYARANGFDNPSVYCADLQRLIAAIQSWTVRQLPGSLADEAGLRPLLAEA